MTTPTTTPLTQEQFDRFARDLKFLHTAAMTLDRGVKLIPSDTTELLLCATRLQAVPIFLVPQVCHAVQP